jgi:hypothetical protein
MIRASLFAFAFDLFDTADRKPLVVKAARGSNPHATNIKICDGDEERLPGNLCSESVFWGVHLPC